MSYVHIYRVDGQPAVRYVDNNLDEPIIFTNAPNKLLWVGCCYRRRPAKNCVVQVYYDASYCWCAEGKGCKSEKEITEKRNREFRNRSRGAKQGWKTRKQVAP